MRPPRHRTTLAASLLIGAVLPAHAAEPPAADLVLEPMMCPEELHFGERTAAPALGPGLTLGEGIQVLSDGLQVTADGDAHVQGNVELRDGERSLRAEEVEINNRDRTAKVRGSVQYRGPGIQVSGESGSFADGVAEFSGAEFEMPRQPARGAAEQLSFGRDGVLRLKGVRYTTCPPGHSDWLLQADSISIDTKSHTGTARDMRLEFLGVPILRLPVITFPVGNVRKSGFLFPSMGGSSRGGLMLSTPYYFNLAPGRDATFSPTWYSRRGVDLGGEFRYLTARSEGIFDGNLLPDDRVFNDTRGRLRWRNLTSLPANWRLRIDAEDVSDTAYFEDFPRGADGASIAFVPRMIEITYRDDTWRLGAMARNFQTIDQALQPDERPYTELPRLYADALWRLRGALPLEYGFTSEASGFQRNVGVEGWRMDVAPRVALDYQGAGYFLRPALAFEATQYRLEGAAPGADRSPSRALPIASVDAGLLFERAVGSHGRQRLTLEPRAMYLYVPYRNQDALPVFDTGEPDLNWVELFRTNRYVGFDRVSDANQVSLGVTSRLFASNSGTRYLSATLGQTFYFDVPQVHLPDEPVPTESTSDFIAQVELRAFQNWSVDLGVQWDPQAHHAERSEVRVQFAPGPQQVLNLGYRFQRDRLEQAEFSAAWPVAKNWNLYGRMLYSLRDEQSIESFAGFEYSSCCWGIRAVFRDYVSRRSGERDRSIYLQLELKGLSNVGLSADAVLERAIRGYSADPRPR